MRTLFTWTAVLSVWSFALPAKADDVPQLVVVDGLIVPVGTADGGLDEGKHDAAKSKFRAFLAKHRREPDGIPRPIGAGNAWTEFKYVFGSARQFFGTGDASVGIWHRATVPGPNRYGD